MFLFSMIVNAVILLVKFILKTVFFLKEKKMIIPTILIFAVLFGAVYFIDAIGVNLENINPELLVFILAIFLGYPLVIGIVLIKTRKLRAEIKQRKNKTQIFP